MIQKIRKSIPWLLPIIAAILVIGLVLSRVFSPESDSGPPEPEMTITAFEASEHIGAAAEVCGEVVSSNYLTDVRGRPAFLNFGEPHPDQVFTVVIFGEDRNRFRTPPEEAYRNRNICVSGRINMHEGVPQIVVSQPDQIRLSE